MTPGWALAACAACAACARTGGEPPRVDVTRGDLVITVEVTGALRAVDATPIRPPATAGQATCKLAWIAPEGSDVAAGDRLVTLDPTDLDTSLETARNDASQAARQLERKRQTLALSRREEELRLLFAESAARRAALRLQGPSELASAIEHREHELDSELTDRTLDQTRSEIAATRHADEVDLQDTLDTLEVAQRTLAELERSRARLTITAPRAGTVVYGAGTGGQSRSVGDTLWLSDVILQVAGLDAMAGDGLIDEIDAGRVAVHQPVALRLDALPDLTLHGSVASVATSVVAASDADPGKQVQLQIAIAPTAGAGLRPGMRFRGDIEIERIAGAIQVPAEAVFVTADGPVAYRDTAHGLERVAVRIGRRSAEAIEIAAGLSPGDRVATIDPAREVP
ncbi:MAG TPA: HlyD family efflux transporter periplasmic adaptor subunit [Kofleriaceae bacterium]|nr:HlyD family efflux transporter periplasmic adaptor subunit [Kofleriaceae bacterium]